MGLCSWQRASHVIVVFDVTASHTTLSSYCKIIISSEVGVVVWMFTYVTHEIHKSHDNTCKNEKCTTSQTLFGEWWPTLSNISLHEKIMSRLQDHWELLYGWAFWWQKVDFLNLLNRWKLNIIGRLCWWASSPKNSSPEGWPKNHREWFDIQVVMFEWRSYCSDRGFLIL